MARDTAVFCSDVRCRICSLSSDARSTNDFKGKDEEAISDICAWRYLLDFLRGIGYDQCMYLATWSSGSVDSFDQCGGQEKLMEYVQDFGADMRLAAHNSE